MEVLRDGTFTFTIQAEALARGLRPSKRVPRNSKYLIECIGAVGYDTVLQVIDDLENDRMNTSGVITDTFPYPQVFIFTNMVIVCSETTIYEWVASALVPMVGPVAAGELWSAIDFLTFIYLTNGSVAVQRNPATGVYSVTTDYPIARAICNFNSQVFVGSPVE